ncbi:MAG: FtsQ-type POTRA domain-containing protein, partial [Alphaproteobacteria bacterium]|nr:FtsQ-type POTRA domain-containing protein [Alphaproteobacteria bacterium]
MKRENIISCLLAVCICNFAHAGTLNSVKISGNQRMDDESIRILADIKVGDTIDENTANNIVKKLQSSGYFSTV